jgi:hypothetical protein
MSKYETEFEVPFKATGFQAYLVDKLVECGMHGKDRQEVLERIVLGHIISNFGALSEVLGISREEAMERGYVKAPEESKG